MFPYIKKNRFIQRYKPLIKPIYLGLAKLLTFVFEFFVFTTVKILKFTFGIELINDIIFIAPKPFVKVILKSCGCKIGKNTDISPHLIITTSPAGDYSNLVIKDGCFIGKGVYFDLARPIEIGKNTAISGQVTIYTHQTPGQNNKLIHKFPKKKGEVIIGSNSWIGARSTILCGVTIGDHTLVGASSLVIKNISSYSVVVGVPAKVIKKIEID